VLQPSERATVLDALRPPEGATLDMAVATTFSLDLLTLLMAPWAFALLESRAQHSRAEDDNEAVGLLDAVRRHADRLTVFCQAGQIALRERNRLVPLLERCVVPVTVPAGLFHPKVWLLAYRSPAGDLTHRLIISSRNLTPDRSWDVLLRLEQSSRGTILPQVADLVDALPGLAIGGLERRRAKAMRDLAARCREVRWAMPNGFDRLRVHVLGLGPVTASLWPKRADRVVVVSPFLGPELLARLPRAPRRVLVSRPDALDGLAHAAGGRDPGWTTMVLDADASPPAEQGGALRPADPATALVGLHAKLYGWDAGGRSTWLVGSANATMAGWEANVEVVVELGGRRAAVGVEQALDDRVERPALADLLLPYDAGDGRPSDEDADGDALDAARRELGAVSWRGTVRATSAGYIVEVRSGEPVAALLRPIASASAYPASVPAAERPLGLDELGHAAVTFLVPSLHLVTRLVVLQLKGPDRDTSTVVVADLDGVPDERDQAIIRTVLADGDRLLRYLLLLLGDAGNVPECIERVRWLEAAGGDVPAGPPPGMPLLEAMVRAAHQDRERLAHIDALLVDLGDDARQLLPDGFLETWHAVTAAVRVAR